MSKRILAAVIVVACAGVASAQPTMDGTRDDGIYCTPLAIQDTQTGFGNSSQGQVGDANGTELDAVYAVVNGGNLYVFLSGNLAGFNKIELFFDTVAGGQNRLLGGVTGGAAGGLNRMGDNGSGNGFTFEAGFEADYWITITQGGGSLYVDGANIPTAAGGVADYRGTTTPASNGVLTGGTNPGNIKVTWNNSNTGGVAGGNGVDTTGLSDDVYTGFEFEIPLAAIGSPTGDIKLTTFVNGQQHDYMCNQFLSGITAFTGIGADPRSVDLGNNSSYPGTQYVTIPQTSATCGACCLTGGDCVLTASAGDCTGQGGQFQGLGSNCTPNPCATTGACCTAGNTCQVVTQNNCENVLFGEYLGDNTNCTGNPCQTGACCLPGNECTVQREAQCTSNSGTYLGNNSNCDNAPCTPGACCVGGTCTVVRGGVCFNNSGIYFGNGTDCTTTNNCVRGACCFANTCVFTYPALCTSQSGNYQGNGVNCVQATCSTPAGYPVVDGMLDAAYCDAQIVQTTQTQFGDATSGLIDVSTGSEIDAAYAVIVGNRLFLFFSGNLESNSNKLEIFFDTVAGGQNHLGVVPGYPNPIVVNPDTDFGALGRMGSTDGTNGLTFDAGFAPDYWMNFSNRQINPTAGQTVAIDVNYAELFVDDDNPGVGYYLGEGRAANLTNGGLLDHNVNTSNPYGILATINNSNTAGVPGGQLALDAAGVAAAEAVTKGTELSIPLSAIGNPSSLAGIKICVFVNGSGNDFVSNQVLGGLGASDNLAEVRNVNFTNNAGDQHFTLFDACAPGCLRGDANCDNLVNNFDIDFFVNGLLNLNGAYLASGGTQGCYDIRNCWGDINQVDGFNNFDIDPFVACILSPPGEGFPCP